MSTTARAAATPTHSPSLAGKVRAAIALFGRIPHTLLALLARFSIAAVFWNSGQTKVDGLALNFITGDFKLGWPRLSASAIDLFRDEYRLPLIPLELAAPLAASAEQTLPILLLIGLGTRFSALALLGMTLVIQIFVYPGAYATHGTWATVLLFLIAHGPGKASLDHWIASRNRKNVR
jgi:putative oxidoreductase